VPGTGLAPPPQYASRYFGVLGLRIRDTREADASTRLIISNSEDDASSGSGRLGKNISRRPAVRLDIGSVRALVSL
jgi:hypothetical protein